MRLPATTRAERGSVCWAEPTARDLCTWTQRRYPTELAMECSIRVGGGTRPAGKEHDHETAHGHRRRGDRQLRVGRSAVYQLITARQRESIKIGRSQRASVASTTPHRGPECGVVYVAGGLALRS